ncbi:MULTISPECIES: ABC transporter substrate-binding protein [Sphingobium]|jgi:ABC-type nitrate/sulfonate/bicarbonate transport system substrate-binding protein|uniref:ABC transporter substrate-binding protein n=3 Tax=Sphingobium fuliginis (strain ATCC 27551) TaxID=336203 RepID=A0A4Q4IW52_SPHSA|nr:MULTISPECIES: ABC transporter substrate-binding protein [Sphingobium]AJR25007.1 monooxygenase [Sphingobium sp. YBL2]MCB4859720.1 ABC transporter substrate-binding protein [Sphingobium sp. PNB]PNP99466.1 monooxygenase [Sphingobium sp. SA916]QDC36339.1 ABC transporter substrate-binding protein [Sphingobium fuliginis ATCC 27551]QOT72184.1 ABC transporter substrate-binding protein [Sphingobium fuliginis]
MANKVAPLDSVWVTRCPVPAASGVACAKGWMAEAFAQDGISVRRVQELGLNLVASDPENQARHLFREGGNIQALAARALGAPTRVIGLTWIDERQAIMVRPDVGVMDPADLEGLRFALPGYGRTHGESIARGMALHGIKSALALGGLALEDVQLIEIPAPPVEQASVEGMRRLWLGLEWLAAGRVDAVYVKGAAGAEAAQRLGLEIGIDLDAYPSRLARVNNGTPRPIVVHQHMIDHHPALVERFLEQSLRAADWAAAHPSDLNAILAQETLSGMEGVEAAYRNNFHRALHPDLSDERVEMLKIQAHFLWLHGFLEAPVDVDGWICAEPLRSVMKRRAELATPLRPSH